MQILCGADVIGMDADMIEQLPVIRNGLIGVRNDISQLPILKIVNPSAAAPGVPPERKKRIEMLDRLFYPVLQNHLPIL